MNISDLLLLCILILLVLIVINNFIPIPSNKETITNDLPNNNLTAMGDDNLLIPTNDQVYNENDTNRPDNSSSHQVLSGSYVNNNTDTTLVDTGIDIPLVYSLDEITDTTVMRNVNTPSMLSPSLNKVFDAGSGNVNKDIIVNNNTLNNFRGIE